MCHDFIQRNPGKVITKFNFNFLFSQAWLRAVSAFRTCGVYPFNPQAVDACIDGPKTREYSMQEELPETSVSNTSSATFTDDQVELFTRRFEEGYDLDDAEYSRWLQVHHAEQTTDARLSF